VLAGFDWTPDQLGILMGTGIPIVAIVATFWYKTAKATSENELKRTLAERGMSAEEIERVVAAKPGGKKKENG
jgi:hypothetical protein